MTQRNDTPDDDVQIPSIETSDVAAPVGAVPAPQTDDAGRGLVLSAPDDLAAWWDGIDAELAALPAAPDVEHDALRSTDFADTYRVRLTSIGGYRIAAWLSIPTGAGPFPALFLAPAYGSVVTPPMWEDRQRYVAMSLMHRGTRGADKPWAAAFPGLLTDGIDDPQTWVYRAIFADALRAFEYLVGRPEVDPARIAIQGADAGLLIAARRPVATAIAVGAAFFHRLAEVYPATEAYPFEEINDHLRANPGAEGRIARTLSYVDPVHLAGAVTARVHLAVGDPGGTGDAEWFADLTAAISGEVTHYAVTHEGQTDRDAVDAWLAGQLGVEPKPKIWAIEEIGAWT